ncbi:Response regulators consisting of a CheY-like receiver domain and a winged-helix DNA-binding domain [[Clostridium] cf. saccharolyticum K10]|nr:Response regulators consisting of a CheY-like receiver domain and a winged-helix DNA-binding domain [[Clostridium] cf. saccharolyticum K10]
MNKIEIVLRTTDPSGQVKEQLLAEFDAGHSNKSKQEILQYSGLCIDSLQHQVSYQGEVLPLTENYEFHTLAYLASQPGRVFTKEQIYQAVWKEEPVDVSSAVFCVIANIRRKLKKVTTKEYIRTVWGVGYKFDPGI